VVVDELFIAGAHDPEILFKDVAGNEIDPPEQIGETCVNVGRVGALTVIIT
jgi:hypothetical protein